MFTPIDQVEAALRSIDDLELKVSESINSSIMDIMRDQEISSCSPNIKSTVGAVVETYLIPRLGLEKNPTGIDTKIAGHDVDIKHSFGTSWMIGPECVNHICLLLQTNQNGEEFSCGLVEAIPENLNKGRNRDAKVSLSKTGRESIRWLVRNAALPKRVDPRDAKIEVLEKRLAEAVTQVRLLEIMLARYR